MMRWKVAGVILCAVSLVGCSNDVQQPAQKDEVTVRTVMGDLLVGDVERDVEQRMLSAHVEGDQLNATLRIVPAGDGTTTMGGTATLTDDEGKLLFLLEITVNQETGELTYSEATSEDYLTFSLFEKDDRIRESYNANGDVAVFEHAALTDETQRHAINHLEHGGPSDYLPGDIREYIDQADAFRHYYLPHATSSIQDNMDGEVLVQLLASQELGQLVKDGMPGADKSRVIETFCNMVMACATFACQLFPGNAICTFCAGAAVACQIYDILTIWLPGWN